MSQAMFLFRMASSKVWEAINKIRSKEVASTLGMLVLPHMLDGPARLKSLNAVVNAAKWLKDFRNGMGFHYPDFSQWEQATTPDDTWVDDKIFVGASSGNSFYHAADTITQHWTFQEQGRQMGPEAIDARVSEMISLLRTMTNFLEEALGNMVTAIAGPDLTANAVGKVLAPHFHGVSIPFWTSQALRD